MVKTIYVGEAWSKDHVWIQNSFTGNKLWFRERAMHAQLSSVGNMNNIVRYRGATENEKQRLQRLYMEFCPHGDLADLLYRHAKYDHANRCDELDDEDNPVPPVRIPIRALWAFFRDLATAAGIMAIGHGPFDSETEVPSDWEEIIHRDIKPSNIFLAAPPTKTGRGIPVCKMGDFGITVPRDYEPLPNPEEMCNAGTKGWRPPEQQGYNDAEHRRELSSATNVWAIGRIMLALIELKPRNLPHVRYDDENEGHVLQSDERAALMAYYGEAIYQLIEECLEPSPQDRIPADGLLNRIHQHIDSSFEEVPLELEHNDVLEYGHDLRWAN